jgi:hypothetical protein
MCAFRQLLSSNSAFESSRLSLGNVVHSRVFQPGSAGDAGHSLICRAAHLSFLRGINSYGV